MACFAVACCREACSQHYNNNGLGKIKDSEQVILAVFNITLKAGDQLDGELFPTKKLAKGDLSLARDTYASEADLVKFVIGPKLAANANFNGLAKARASRIRQIICVSSKFPREEVRAACVIDKVEESDYASHAALQFCIEQDGWTQNKKNVFRALISLDLARIFDTLYVPERLEHLVANAA